MALTPYYTDNGSVFITNPTFAQKEFKGVVTEFNLDPGTRDISVEHTFSDSFVNQARPDLAEVTMTVVASGGDLPLYILGGTATDVYPKTYTGDSAKVRPDVKFLQFDQDTAAQKVWVFSGAYMTDMSESNTTDEATTWDFTFKTLAKDASFEWTPDAAASGLTDPIGA